MALSEAGQWLEESLLKLSADTESGLQLDADLVYSLVSYCEMATPSDAAEYLMNIVADDRCTEIVTEYLQRRGGGGVDPQGNATQEASMQAYVKPRDDEVWSTTSKKTQKQKTDESAFSQRDAEQKSSSSGSSTRAAPSAGGQKPRQGGGKGKRGGKGVSLAEAAQGQVIFKRSGPCNCQCTRHNLVNNCLSCGRIVCEQEGEGPCTFCGALVLREGSDYAGLDGVSVPLVSEAELKAEEFKNRLVEYDRTSAARTTVIDDQSEYFNIDGNTWLTDQEKEMLKKRQEDEERIAEERRKRVVVTIDLLGRKVVMADQGNAEEKGGQSILGGGLFVGKDVANVPRIKPNPFVKQSPLFTEEKKPVKSGGSGKSAWKWSGAVKRSSRIQHDDPVVEALVGHNLEDIGISSLDELSNAWQGPKAKASAMEEEADSVVECRLDMGGMDLDAPPSTSGVESSKPEVKSPPEVFDICLPRTKGKQNPIVLAPSLLKQKQAERIDAGIESFNLVIQPGLILLKRWLTIDQQVDIVRQCRHLGVGPGGFYRPQYREEDKMHLRMMCLGMQWQPTVRSYEPRRTTYDNALAPPIPESFLRMVDKALSVAQILAAEESGGGKSKRIVIDQNSSVPSMSPDICIVNFYEFSGNLGMHQDKDESPESLKKGLPVVSFSIGDSGEFIYGWNNDPETAEKVVLDSGDVIIFGGPSRMLFHGVTKILKETAPEALLQKTNLRPGRLNLTFRQH